MLESDAIQSSGEIMRRLAELEAKVQQLAAARSLEASSSSPISVDVKAGIRVLHENGIVMFEAARFDSAFGPVDRVTVQNLDGAQVLLLQSNLFGFEDWSLRDGEGNTIINCEPNLPGDIKGRGLKAPYIPGQFQSMTTPTDSTASGTFTTLQKAIWRKQHAAVYMWVLHNVTSTTGEIRWRINTGPDAATVIGGPATISGGPTLAAYGPFAVPGNHLSEFELDVQGRVASGAGAVAVRTIAAIGREA